jgi:pyruvate dehydrogenase E1 component alpha subunit
MAKVERKGRGALSEERQREFLREMLLIRRFEEKVEERFRAGELPGFLHVAIGQEAVAVGVCQAMEDGDVFASTHRAHGHTLARGTHPNAVMAELYGKLEGCSHGYGGSMHLYDVERGNIGANAVVGAGLPQIAGAALASRWRSSATGRPTSARFTSRSTWRSSGRCRRSSCSKTTTGPSPRPRASTRRFAT